jgi:hypothetical protein
MIDLTRYREARQPARLESLERHYRSQEDWSRGRATESKLIWAGHRFRRRSYEPPPAA